VTRRVGSDLSKAHFGAILKRIEDDLMMNRSIAELAATIPISASCFARLFKQITGLTLCNYVIHRRIERAKQLMVNGELDLADIAVVVGFADQAHLTRHFKKVTGITPAQFCNQHGALKRVRPALRKHHEKQTP
jgi:AraC family transcriptional regulator